MWLLLTSEVGGLGHLVAARRDGGELPGDAAGLPEPTRVPGAVWIAAGAGLIGWAVWRGAGLGRP